MINCWCRPRPGDHDLKTYLIKGTKGYEGLEHINNLKLEATSERQARRQAFELGINISSIEVVDG